MLLRLFHHSAIYSVANLASKGVGLVLLPIYVTELTENEFGLFDYITTLGLFVSAFVTFEISQGVTRELTPALTANEKEKVVSSCFLFLVFMYSLAGVVIFLTKNLILENYAPLNSKLLVYSLLLWFGNSALHFTIVVNRSLQDPVGASIFSMISAIMSGVGVFVVLKIGHGLVGVLSAVAIVQIFAAIANLSLRIRLLSLLNIDFSVLKKVLDFSTPLIISSLSIYGLTYVDRLVIERFLGLEELGLYAVPARLATGAVFLVYGIQMALAPLVYANPDDNNVKGMQRRLVGYYFTFTVCLVAACKFISYDIFYYLLPPQYAGGSVLLPILLLSALLINGASLFLGLSVNRKTSRLAAINLLAFVANFAGNIILVPALGLIGAAVSTMLSSLGFIFLSVYLSEREYPIFAQ